MGFFWNYSGLGTGGKEERRRRRRNIKQVGERRKCSGRILHDLADFGFWLLRPLQT